MFFNLVGTIWGIIPVTLLRTMSFWTFPIVSIYTRFDILHFLNLWDNGKISINLFTAQSWKHYQTSGSDEPVCGNSMEPFWPEVWCQEERLQMNLIMALCTNWTGTDRFAPCGWSWKINKDHRPSDNGKSSISVPRTSLMKDTDKINWKGGNSKWNQRIFHHTL